MKNISICSAASAIAILTLGLSGTSATAQTTSECAVKARTGGDYLTTVLALGRAKNVARQAAELANGGLTRYHAEAVMHGPVGEVPCTDDGSKWTFTFKGGAPGAAATVESVVSVDRSTGKATVDYNGAIR